MQACCFVLGTQLLDVMATPVLAESTELEQTLARMLHVEITPVAGFTASPRILGDGRQPPSGGGRSCHDLNGMANAGATCTVTPARA